MGTTWDESTGTFQHCRSNNSGHPQVGMGKGSGWGGGGRGLVGRKEDRGRVGAYRYNFRFRRLVTMSRALARAGSVDSSISWHGRGRWRLRAH
jgi:hypothetical protein